MSFFSLFGGRSNTVDYQPFISYFKTKPLGSEPPVMTIFSNLPPKDRCEILAGVLKDDSSNINVYDKLSMAYLKNNQLSTALNCLDTGLRSSNLSGQNHAILTEKIRSMNEHFNGRFGSSANYGEALQRIERDYNTTKKMGFDFSEFVSIIKQFCQKKLQ